jgi:UDP-N-acetyl-D-galactosamine dehydrogenase
MTIATAITARITTKNQEGKGPQTDPVLSPRARALQERLAGTPTVALIGLGYVGLPLAVAFAESGALVTGFDLDAGRIAAI